MQNDIVDGAEPSLQPSFLPFPAHFTLQYAYCKRELGLPDEKVNPNGGAIALGHPIGEPAGGWLSLAIWPFLSAAVQGFRPSFASPTFSPHDQPLARPSAGCSGARQTVTLLHELARRNNSSEKHEVGWPGCGVRV